MIRKMPLYCLLILLYVLPLEAAEPGAVLDEFHRAAARADLESYFSLMTDQVVFLGTDGSERWQGQQFRDFVRPRFESGKGWDYRPYDRHILLGADGRTAWFDEALSHAELGQCRGSGVLVMKQGQWRVAQYNLSVPIPNAIVDDVVEQIQAQSTGTGGEEVAKESEETPVSCRKRRHKTNRVAGC